MEQVKKFLDCWGYYFLALLCAAVILLSALWTNQQRIQSQENAQALADESQRLQQAQQEESGLLWPTDGTILRPFSQAPVYEETFHLWQAHRGIDFSAKAEAAVYAMAPGRIALAEETVCIDHGGESRSLYRGLAKISVQEGQYVKAGDILGVAGKHIPFEGDQIHICVQMIQENKSIDFSGRLVDKIAK